MISGSHWIKRIFYGNYFYGICAVALSIECSLQLQLPLNNIFFYLALFCTTVLYYTHAYYIEIKKKLQNDNERAAWYRIHQKQISRSQLVFTFVLGLIVLLLFNGLQPLFVQLPFFNWVVLLGFGLIGGAYYKSLYPEWGNWGLRNNGLIKPFLIGWVWAGAVSFAPVFFYDLTHPGAAHTAEIITWLLFLKNWLFISLLCILFDIKDYASDANQPLKTWVVKMGLRKTLFSLIIPVAFISLGLYWLLAWLEDFSLIRILFNTIPYILLITVSTQMHRRKSILYYLAIIDGLMLVKAICGALGMLGT